MATAFQSVNISLSPAHSGRDETMTSPTTPRPNVTPYPPPEITQPKDDASTPTRANFGSGAMATQRPLPTSPFPDSVNVPSTPDQVRAPKRENSQHSRKSKDSDEMDMDESDLDDGAGSDDESVNADGTRSGKKKKSQRFYCTDYPPCNLSFTRSEHLARHIRKHTGERPFQCHCSRRFSRLDNLRQHAQTVHVNEDIPMDSLAATGTRFQRQVRTDRVRQAGGRARASTASSIGSVTRGHSKSLSTSSITSVSSVSSNFNMNDMRRRPPPLVMADPRSRFSAESYRDHPYYRAPSPSDFSTPTSATFSTGQGSPRWGSGMASPISSHSRSHSMYASSSRTPGRRLSVPSPGGNPFQSPHGLSVRGPHLGSNPMQSPTSGAYSPGSTGPLGSPTLSTSQWSRRDSVSSMADEAWRRRTWHPDTREYNGASRLSQVITQSQIAPDTLPAPNVNSANAPSQQTLRLPGIESFDPVPHRPATPPRRNPSPMVIDSESKKPSSLLAPADINPEERRNVHWDANIHRGLTRLDINTPPRDSAGAWANETNQAIQGQAERFVPPPSQPTVRFDMETRVQPPTSVPTSHNPPSYPSRHHYTLSAPSISANREIKRHGWYHGPAGNHPVGETIHEGRAHVDRIVHPNVSAFQGFPTRESQPIIHQQPGIPVDRAMEPSQGTADSMRRLEALVAVATSEGSTAAAY